MQQVWEQPLLEQAGFVHIDATYWGRGAGILLAIDHHTARPLYLEFIRNECAQDYRRALEVSPDVVILFAVLWSMAPVRSSLFR
ncbi:hypothetical protein [Porphyromonas gingivalis]|uniref:hypothetical protein n=1 Tax=Porphyromonas gingivalis TaxID=837 RepID=UPI00201268F7|nr:hypothetical protein [Porphyromonas gingivalis]